MVLQKDETGCSWASVTEPGTPLIPLSPDWHSPSGLQYKGQKSMAAEGYRLSHVRIRHGSLICAAGLKFCSVWISVVVRRNDFRIHDLQGMENAVSSCGVTF